MPTIPCKVAITCPGGNTDNGFDFPFGNYSSEAPDQLVFGAVRFPIYNPDNPLNQDPTGVDPSDPNYWISVGCTNVCYSTQSQQAANLCAAANAYICAHSRQPGGPPVHPLFYNQEQICCATCPDGLTFCWTVAAGSFVSTNQDLANRMAFQSACDSANRFRICLGNLPTTLCQNQFFTKILNPNGGVGPFVFTIASGNLPAGLDLEQNGQIAQISGIPTGTGSSTFAIKVTDSNGNFMIKTYTMGIMAVTPVILPNGAMGSAYSAQFATSGGVGPYEYSVAGSPAPAPAPGLQISPTGAVIGTPTSVGDFPFVLLVKDSSGVTCQFGITQHIAGVCNAEVHGFETCPGDPGKVASLTIPAGKYCFPLGGSQANADALASCDLINQLALSLQGQGCGCTMTVDHAAKNITSHCSFDIDIIVLNKFHGGLPCPICPGFAVPPGQTVNWTAELAGAGLGSPGHDNWYYFFPTNIVAPPFSFYYV